MPTIRLTAVTAGLSALLVLSGCGGSADGEDPSSTSQQSPQETSTQQPSPSESGSTTELAESYPTQKKNACEVLDAKVATSLLGQAAEKGGPAPVARAEGTRVSSCLWANAVQSSGTARSVSLLMRVAIDETGAQSNSEVFDPQVLPGGARPVEGYGDAAFWNPAFGQLNILDQGNWYILSSGPIDPKRHTLAQTRKLADAVIDQL